MVASVSVSCCSLLKSCLVGGGVGCGFTVVDVGVSEVVVVLNVDDVTAAEEVWDGPWLVAVSEPGSVDGGVSLEQEGSPVERQEVHASVCVVQLVTAQHLQQQLPAGAVENTPFVYDVISIINTITIDKSRVEN